MTRKLLTGLNLLVFITVFSQSGIGTQTPEGALDISYPDNEWGLVIPHIDQAENTKNPTGKNVKKGTIVYDLKENCIRYFNGSIWSGCILEDITDPIKLDCSLAVLNQDVIANYPVSTQTTVSIPYSNLGENFDYRDITFLSKNVTGLIAVLPSGSIKKGSGVLVFHLSGTPSAQGEAKFSLSIAGVTCEFVITVKNYVDIKVPVENFACELENQLNVYTLKGEHIIDGEKVMVTNSSNIKLIKEPGTYCGITMINNAFHLGAEGGNIVYSLTLTFSRPVTNIGISFGGSDAGEAFTFTTNNNQPVQLTTSGRCESLIKITGNKIDILNNTNVGGYITVGGKWFTQLTIRHNGKKAGTAFGFCLNSSSAL
ncbi:hypothetical protein OIU80_11500 [Flavobacterium sp. LS1R47]|uniref:Uncharacterized protein n=1 Tax=Flavobacterium frigoritolerans TaxID=2987686 RepID=A0A9X2ZNX0_9FLAO|nr:hypothetical protein [Flavobacterium frigoritolerans]MCV9932910.1 hypothetical protein [Flavobacterium frigoritolerans]